MQPKIGMRYSRARLPILRPEWLDAKVPTLHDLTAHHFASDNYAGIHPEVLAAIGEANGGHQRSYGEDDYTAAFETRVREIFGRQAEPYIVLNGTGANVVSLQAMTGRGDAVICVASAHINTDETGAPEHVGGIKLLTVAGENGKMSPDELTAAARSLGDQHRAQPRVLSLTQATELGTCYTVKELTALTECAHALGLRVHLDGARLANAAAHLGLSLADLTVEVGIDVLSLGGTKLGALGAEAMIVINPEAVQGLPYLRKASLQLGSKSRFSAAQLLALFGTDLWLRIASHSNAMAKLLAHEVAEVPEVRISRPVESNAVFASLPVKMAERAREFASFYTWNEDEAEVRWMTAFDTEPHHIKGFVAALDASRSQ